VRFRARALMVLALVASLGGAGIALRAAQTGPQTATSQRLLVGRVVDERGQPVPKATIQLSGGSVAQTDQAGSFSVRVAGGPLLITASAAGHLSRTQAADAGTATDIILTTAAATTVSLRFGGDVMFGRRFYDRNDDGNRDDAILAVGASAAAHAALLAHVKPLLEDADLTLVNLETPLVTNPWFSPKGPRPGAFNPDKEYAYASAPESAQALLDSGVDLVDLGNNHVFDALGPGLASTFSALDRVGIPHFGAGRTLDEAWAPAFIRRKGQGLAFIGCTTVTGSEHLIPDVANAARGGAAQCTTARLRQEVAAARSRADLVVVMIHGGEEYNPSQTTVVRQLTSIASEAGAALVVNSHPHVVGGITVQGKTVVAETMGNLLFDQTVWPTFPSYLLRVDLRAGSAVLATVDPILQDAYLPRPVVGLPADAASRRAAGMLPGPVRLLQPGAVYAPDWPVGNQQQQLSVKAGTLARLSPGWWVSATPAGSQTTLGEDLLWTGSFEDLDTDPSTPGAHQWQFGASVLRTSAAACSGVDGMELLRSPTSTRDVVLTPAHRQLVRSGTALSLVAEIRGASTGATLELALYGDTQGPSVTTLRATIPARATAASGACQRVRIDTRIQPGIVAVQPFLRLASPKSNVRAAHLLVDDVRLVAWAAAGASGRRYDTVEVREDTTLELRNDRTGAKGPAFVNASH